jgi:hypothetical protein
MLAVGVERVAMFRVIASPLQQEFMRYQLVKVVKVVLRAPLEIRAEGILVATQLLPVSLLLVVAAVVVLGSLITRHNLRRLEVLVAVVLGMYLVLQLALLVSMGKGTKAETEKPMEHIPVVAVVAHFLSA